MGRFTDRASPVWAIPTVFLAMNSTASAHIQYSRPGLVITGSQKITTVHKVTPQQAQRMSNQAVAALRNVVNARGEIRNLNFDAARSELTQAATILSSIRADLPTSRIKDRLAIAQKHLDIDTVEKVLTDLVPIYTDLKSVEHLLPADQIRHHLDLAKVSLKAGDKNTAHAELRAADDSVAYTEVDLPVRESQQGVVTAISALEQGEPDRAERALRVVENSLQVSFVAVTEKSRREPPLPG